MPFTFWQHRRSTSIAVTFTLLEATIDFFPLRNSCIWIRARSYSLNWNWSNSLLLLSASRSPFAETVVMEMDVQAAECNRVRGMSLPMPPTIVIDFESLRTEYWWSHTICYLHSERATRLHYFVIYSWCAVLNGLFCVKSMGINCVAVVWFSNVNTKWWL